MDFTTLALMAALFIGGYFILIRPQQKRAKAQQELLSKLEVGTRVLLNSGIIGTIRHLGERQAVVEVSPGVELTLLRQAIVRPTKPDEEEFEYADEAEHDEPAAAEAFDSYPVPDTAAELIDPPATPESNELPDAGDDAQPEKRG